MAFCTQCGAQIDDNAVICPSCGAQREGVNINANNGYNAGFTPPPVSMGNDFTQQFDPNDIQQNKVFSVLAYFGFLFLIPMLAAPNSQFARFHTNQGLVLFLFDIAGGIAVSIITAIFVWVPIVGGIIITIVSSVVSLGIAVLLILGVINAATGKAKELPVIGKIRILK